ncbi:MAG: peptide/nickel transport system permease protein [Actinomycetota bacterium]|jgi:peptide/nickel transport system permease protein|nr:peptide/nickel transport system permease protein [Actinomycetota bacterium]
MTMSAGDTLTQDHAPVEDVGAHKGIEGRSLGQIAWFRLKHDKIAMLSMFMIILILLLAILAPLITKVLGVDPTTFYRAAVDPDKGFLPKGGPLGSGISGDHLLGVEPGTGRDTLARLLYGARISLLIALSATVVSVVIGTILGALAGYLGGKMDAFISRLMDLLLAFPQLILLIAMTPVFVTLLDQLGVPGTPGRVLYLIVFIGFFGWPYFGRIIRGQVLSLREREFVEAARSLGAGTGHVLFRQLLPNLWASILVFSSLIIPTYIGTEAALSFLGVGVVPPTPTWGNMLGDSVRYARVDPLYLFIPGLALFTVVLFFNLFGDALRDVLDPRGSR